MPPGAVPPPTSTAWPESSTAMQKAAVTQAPPVPDPYGSTTVGVDQVAPANVVARPPASSAVQLAGPEHDTAERWPSGSIEDALHVPSEPTRALPNASTAVHAVAVGQ